MEARLYREDIGPPRDHAHCPWPPDSACHWYHYLNPTWCQRNPEALARDRVRAAEYEAAREARRTPEERRAMELAREAAFAAVEKAKSEAAERAAAGLRAEAEERERINELAARHRDEVLFARFRAYVARPERLAHPATRPDEIAYLAFREWVFSASSEQEAKERYRSFWTWPPPEPAADAWELAFAAEYDATPRPLRHGLYPDRRSPGYFEWFARVHALESPEVQRRMDAPVGPEEAEAQREYFRRLIAGQHAKEDAETAALEARLAELRALRAARRDPT
ncbi:MAG: hypothetical protein R3B70_03355 [Polyangiaceae bacterium]